MASIPAILSNSDFRLPATWLGGIVPGAGDVAFANGNTVLISDARTVQAISNATGTGITVGGTFSLLNGCNLTCTSANGVVQGATSTSCITTPSLGVGSSASVVANITSTTTAASFTHSSNGEFNWIGSIAGTNGPMPIVSGNGVYNHTGNITGPTSGAQLGFQVTGAATVSITGNIAAGPGSANNYGLNISGISAQVTVTGNIYGGIHTGSPTSGIVNNAAATLTVNGICQSGAGGPAIGLGSIAQITRLSGPFLLGTSGNINPVQAQSWRWSPTLIPTYMEIAQSNGSAKRLLYSPDNMPTGGYPVAANVRQSTVYGPSSDLVGTLAVPAASSVAAGVPVDNGVGTAVLTGANILSALGLATGNLDTKFSQIPAEVWSSSTRTLTSGGGGSSPTATEIAAEVWSTATRTLTTVFPSIPTAADIATAVWNAATRTITTTIPSAIDIAVAVWGAVTRTLTSSSAPTATDVATAVWANTARTITGGTVNTILDKVGYSLTSSERLAIATAVEQSILNENDGQAILNAIVGAIGNTNIDQVTLIAAIRADLERNGGMLAGRSTLTAGGVRAELSTELARLDVTVSSRLAPTGTLSTVTTLTNAPSVPSAATIASQVRTELTTELSRLDVATSTRLASASYSAAPTTAAIRTELSVELARLDTPVSSRLAPSGTLARVTLTDTTTTLTSQPSFPATSEIASAVWNTPSRTITGGSVDKTGYSLTAAERQAIATAVEQSILNESDGQAILNAIVGAIGNSNVDQVALVAAIRADMERAGGMLSGRSTLTAAQVWTHTSRTITGGTIDNASQTTIAAGEVAAAVRAELNPELERLRNCSTMDTTAAALANALKQ